MYAWLEIQRATRAITRLPRQIYLYLSLLHDAMILLRHEIRAQYSVTFQSLLYIGIQEYCLFNSTHVNIKFKFSFTEMQFFCDTTFFLTSIQLLSNIMYFTIAFFYCFILFYLNSSTDKKNPYYVKKRTKLTVIQSY